MFPVPQPLEGPSQTPIIDVDSPTEALEMFLQVIYPIPNPPIKDAETLTSLIRLADKRDVKAVLDAHKDYLPSTCITPPPIHTYAIFCARGREKEAEAAACRVSFASFVYLNSSPLLRLMTVGHYQRLVEFMVARDRRMREISTQNQKKIAKDCCARYKCSDEAHKIYSGTIVAAIQATFGADPCTRMVEALGLVANTHMFPLCELCCRYNPSGLQGYADEPLKELVEMAESLPWVVWYMETCLGGVFWESPGTFNMLPPLHHDIHVFTQPSPNA